MWFSSTQQFLITNPSTFQICKAKCPHCGVHGTSEKHICNQQNKLIAQKKRNTFSCLITCPV